MSKYIAVEFDGTLAIIHKKWQAAFTELGTVRSYADLHGAEGDAYASPVQGCHERLVEVDMVTGSTSDVFEITSREARVLAARLLRAADDAEAVTA